MRTRSRLLLSFVGIHLILSVVVGIVAWRLMDALMYKQAEENATALGKNLPSFADDVIAKAEKVTGYRMRIINPGEPTRRGTVQVPIIKDAGAMILEIDYQTSWHNAASRASLISTVILMIAGFIVFGIAAIVLSSRFARPVETLSAAADVIGSGDLDQPVPAVGSGELAHLARNLENMRQRIKELDLQHRRDERLSAIGMFTATIAHEVRNPLTAVRLTVQMLAKRHAGDPALVLIMEEIERLDLIVDELLAYSRGMTVQPQPCDLRPLAEDVMRLMRRQAEHAQVELSVTGDARVLADGARLRQMLMNLVLNAIQARHGQGAVRIDVNADGISVIDDGPGVDPALVPHLFEPFAGNRSGGTGLGLHLSWQIAQAHGAKLEYRKLEEGCEFRLSGLKTT
jgi:signal transduction histidine kinase